MENIFYDIVGYEGFYQIHPTEGIRGVDRIVNGTFLKGKILTQSINSNGYLKVGLSKNNRLKNFPVHILLAKAFIPNHNNLPIVRHLNDIKTDNRLENLAWGTHLDNVEDGKRNKVFFSAKGKDHYNFGRKRGIPVNFNKKGIEATNNKIVLDTQTGIFYYGTKDAADTKGISASTLRCKLSGHITNNTGLIYV